MNLPEDPVVQEAVAEHDRLHGSEWKRLQKLHCLDSGQRKEEQQDEASGDAEVSVANDPHGVRDGDGGAQEGVEELPGVVVLDHGSVHAVVHEAWKK